MNKPGRERQPVHMRDRETGPREPDLAREENNFFVSVSLPMITWEYVRTQTIDF